MKRKEKGRRKKTPKDVYRRSPVVKMKMQED